MYKTYNEFKEEHVNSKIVKVFKGTNEISTGSNDVELLYSSPEPILKEKIRTPIKIIKGGKEITSKESEQMIYGLAKSNTEHKKKAIKVMRGSNKIYDSEKDQYSIYQKNSIKNE